jgi:hypothetical protein
LFGRQQPGSQKKGGGPEPGQGSAVVGDPKKRLELLALKAAVEQVRGRVCLQPAGGVRPDDGGGIELPLPDEALG